MKVSAFTFAKNAVQMNYPLREAIVSALPLVDEFVVNVGIPDQDGTQDLVRSIGDPKVKIVTSQWNPHVNVNGYVLAQQTNIALFNCTGEWAIYLQADEVLHEDHYGVFRDALNKYRNDERVEGLSVERIHFYGDYHTQFRYFAKDIVCRAVKTNRFVLSRGDAAAFTVHPKYKERGRRIRVVQVDAAVFHYGWVVSRNIATERTAMINQLWNASDETRRDGDRGSQLPLTLDGEDGIYRGAPRQMLKKFETSHPSAMRELVAADQIRLDLSSNRWRTELTARERSLRRRQRIESMYRGILRRYLSRSDCVFIDP